MAKIVSESVVVTFSKIVKDDDNSASGPMITKELLDTLEAVAQEMGGSAVVVEVSNG